MKLVTVAIIKSSGLTCGNVPLIAASVKALPTISMLDSNDSSPPALRDALPQSFNTSLKVFLATPLYGSMIWSPVLNRDSVKTEVAPAVVIAAAFCSSVIYTLSSTSSALSRAPCTAIDTAPIGLACTFFLMFSYTILPNEVATGADGASIAGGGVPVAAIAADIATASATSRASFLAPSPYAPCLKSSIQARLSDSSVNPMFLRYAVRTSSIISLTSSDTYERIKLAPAYTGKSIPKTLSNVFWKRLTRSSRNGSIRASRNSLSISSALFLNALSNTSVSSGVNFLSLFSLAY